MPIRHARRCATLLLLAITSAAVLAGCGSSSSATGTPGTFTSGGPGGFSISAAQQRKIRSCLRAAGLSSAIPTGRASAVPSGAPSGAPSGGFSGGPRQGGPFGDPQVQAALKACGITLPSRPTGAPTGG